MSGWRELLSQQIQENPPRLTVEEATLLYESAEFHELLDTAFLRRKKLIPSDEVTYLIDRNVNYTNVCTINCQFCSFYRPPNHDETYTQSFEQISARLSELEEIGGSRILMQGGVHPNLDIEWYIDLIKKLRVNHPSIALDCFSPIEIEGIAEISDLSTKDVLILLKDAGMHGLPGGGAEMLVDDLRLNISPKKGSADNWLRIMGEAQQIGLTTSATNVIGFGESYVNRVQHLDKIRQLQDKSISKKLVGFTSFIAWPVQLENNSFGKRNKGKNRVELGISAPEYLRHVAISRLFLDNISHIQASWPTMGMEIAQLALFAGADDIGSTMMEENVVSASGTTKTMAGVKELQRVIMGAGFIPRERDSDYNLMENYISRDSHPLKVIN